MLSEIVDMETLAHCHVTDGEVNLKQNFVCVWYCRYRSVTTIRQSESPTVIRPLKIKLKVNNRLSGEVCCIYIALTRSCWSTVLHTKQEIIRHYQVINKVYDKNRHYQNIIYEIEKLLLESAILPLSYFSS
jgi:hypothetical protein